MTPALYIISLAAAFIVGALAGCVVSGCIEQEQKRIDEHWEN